MRKKMTVYLEDDLLRQARLWAARTGRAEDEIIQEALRSYLGKGVVESVWAKSELTENEALVLAYDELHTSGD